MSLTETRPTRAPAHQRIALLVIATCQLMVVLDASVVNVALPHIQRSLDFSSTGLSWVLNAYALTFGGLLLLGGRAGDILGRRRMLAVGVAIFTVASLLGGLATSPGLLLASRALQGIGAAIASPTALALIATNFPEGSERNRAFGIYAAVSAAGAAIGLIVGGMLTAWASWRWVFFVNVPVGIGLLALSRYIAESERHPGRFDLAGALTSTIGMSALVYGLIRAAEDGWGDTYTVGSFVLAAVLLISFVLVETRASQPIAPLRLFADRTRSAAYGARMMLVAGMFGMFYFLTQYMQEVLDYGPLAAGFGFVPLTVLIVTASRLSPRMLPRFGPRVVMSVGAAITAVGMVWLSQIDETSGYAEAILGPVVLFGAGAGMLFVPLTMLAMSGVDPKDSGAASSMVNVTQQVGGALGLSVLVTVFGRAQRNTDPLPRASELLQAHHALANGIASAFTVAVVFVCGVLLLSLVGFPRSRASAAQS